MGNSKNTSFISKTIEWGDDIRKIGLAIFVVAVMTLFYLIDQDQSRSEAISNAANEYAPLMTECLEQSSTLECLGHLKLIADTDSFESAKTVALEQ